MSVERSWFYRGWSCKEIAGDEFIAHPNSGYSNVDMSAERCCRAESAKELHDKIDERCARKRP